MKLPKSITIAGREYKIVKDPKRAGGSGNLADCIITIGTRLPKEIPIIFLHEVLEVIMVEHNLRYDIPDSEPYQHFLFNFNHKEYKNVAWDLALALKNVNFQKGNQIKDKKNGQKKSNKKKKSSKKKESSKTRKKARKENK